MNIIKTIYSKRYRISFYLRCFTNTENTKAKKIIALLLKNEGVGIESSTHIGKGIIMHHPYGIVLGEHAVIGENVTIYQNVTIGQKNNKYPVIGSNCIIYPNSVIFGNINIGDNCVVGAGSVVNNSFPANSVIAGNPARSVREAQKDS